MFSKRADSFLFVPGLAWLVYATAYLGRINMSITIPYLQSEFGYSKTALGLLASGFFGAYAAGQFVNGILGDRFSYRTFVSLGLLAAGISNIAFGMSRSFPVMFFFWMANGYFQSMLWGPLLRAISESTPRNKRHRATLLMSTSPVAGHFLSYIITGRIALTFGWKIAFLVPGYLLIVMAALWYWSMAKIGRRPEPKGEHEEKTEDAQEQETSLLSPRAPGKRLTRFILESKLYLIIVLGILVGIVKEGLILWGPVIFTELYSRSPENMLFILSFIPLINFAFLLLGGLLIKKYIRNENRTITLFLSAALPPTILLWKAQSLAFPLTVLFFYGLMASIYTANLLMTSYLPMAFARNGRVSAAAGIIDSSFYLGAAIAGPLMGTAAEAFGWNGIFGGILVICAAALFPGLAISAPLRFSRNRQARAGKNNNPPPGNRL